MKTCTRCNVSQDIVQFRKCGGQRIGSRSICITCEHSSNKIYYTNNTKELSISRKLRYIKRRDKELANGRTYKVENRTRLSAQVYAWQKRRMATDPSFRIGRQLRIRLNTAIHGKFKAGSAVRDLGCTIDELRQYLTDRFQPGMTWDNYGKWHIDHIKPLVSFDLTDRNQFLSACHYTNLQPLWAADNLRKGDSDAALS